MPHVEQEYIDWLGSLDTKAIKMNGMRAGRFVFAKEPVLKLEGPIGVL